MTPCIHLGPLLSRQRWPDADSAQWVTVRNCEARGSCTLTRPVAGVPCCAACPQFSPDMESLVAPLGARGMPNPEQGRIAPKSWEYPVTLCLAHLDTLELLEPALELWRLQTVRPYIVVVDTGSPPATRERLERLRAEDLEIHYLRRHSWFHTSAPVGAALDLVHALADTPLLMHSHVDLFPRRRDLIEWLAAQCSPTCPVVGWEMSPRAHRDDWRGMVSHTCTMLHRPSIASSPARWSLAVANDLLGTWGRACRGWPDTETAFNLGLRAAGIPVKILGPETNWERQVNDWWDHARAYTWSKHASQEIDGWHERHTIPYTEIALAEAAQRIHSWKEIVHGAIHCPAV